MQSSQRAPVLVLVALSAGCQFDPGGILSADAAAIVDGARIDGPRIDAGPGDAGIVDGAGVDGIPADAPGPDAMTPDAPLPDAAPPDAMKPPPIQDVVYALPAGIITIDGDLSEWSGLSWQSITAPDDYVDLGGPALDGNDLSARFAARWTAGTLYLAFEVTDDTHKNNFTGFDIWQGDNIQAAFDMADNDGTNYDTTDDYEYGWGLDDSLALLFYRWVAPNGAAQPNNTFAVVRAGTTTTYEIAVPVADLGAAALVDGQQLGFSMLVNDNDDDGNGRSGFVEWTSGIGQTKNPSLFGTMIIYDL